MVRSSPFSIAADRNCHHGAYSFQSAQCPLHFQRQSMKVQCTHVFDNFLCRSQSIAKRDYTSHSLRLRLMCLKCQVPIICFPRLSFNLTPSGTKIKDADLRFPLLQALQVGNRLLDHSVLAY